MNFRETSPSLIVALIPAVLVSAHVIARSGAPDTTPNPEPTRVTTSDVEWGALNPARGKNGPRAANLWGNRTEEGTTGFLVRFSDGFSSPPHIHNVTYRGIVISGLVHNDDPAAAKMWMPPGSFWTQPAGEVHITAAKGEDVLAYIEIDHGPYLVLPEGQAEDNGERPVNVDAANLVWLDHSRSTWIKPAANPAANPDRPGGVEIAYLWGKPQPGHPSGTLVKLPAGFNGTLSSNGGALRAVIIMGAAQHRPSADAEFHVLKPGEYFGSEGRATHEISGEPDAESIIYVRTEDSFEIVPAS
ncbi:DUF4437 domain-containing protein [Luteolibacter algae]|uniref:DUF4437 domain-containing protein n=1 Tax=Luteolibacter algae TaxID=454151 RepID=A0ABW5D8U7_9BACT